MCNAYDIGAKIRPGHNPGWEKLADLPKRSPIRKTDSGLVVRRAPSGELEPQIMRWGFYRHFNASINNTRADKIASESPIWTPAWKNRQRCLIAVDAFFEWSGPRGSKQAHRIRTANMGEDDWMWMAGVWEESTDPNLDLCYSMVTTEANAAMAPIHDRMPVILPPDMIDEYLDAENPLGLLVPFSGALETPECESPLQSKRKPAARDEQLGLF